DGATCSLHDAILAANTDAAVGGSACTAGAGDDIIVLDADVSLATADPHGPGLHATLVRGGLPGLPDISTPIVIQAGAKSLIARAAILPCGNNEATAF